MAKLTLAQIAFLSQHLTDQVKGVKHSVSKAYFQLEMAQKTLKELFTYYNQWVDEEEFDHERK